ncbi:hypothetical protein OUY22_02995 [Nonomuraea sp. MCN248]|uniref:Uncharacterized protein n=1 Tax=Nonomuraea corallina TaxID=2989783 RepID=A0ABT4S592_9ACTN|nr:hypothetical protein [Nonomuraea corallina]MDA0632368.1 hypothetical protein [Nonomuraea corallina]
MLTVGSDTIVVAASAGAAEALRLLLGTLPADLPAAALVVPQGAGPPAGARCRARVAAVVLSGAPDSSWRRLWTTPS